MRSNEKDVLRKGIASRIYYKMLFLNTMTLSCLFPGVAADNGVDTDYCGYDEKLIQIDSCEDVEEYDIGLFMDSDFVNFFERIGMTEHLDDHEVIKLTCGNEYCYEFSILIIPVVEESSLFPHLRAEQREWLETFVETGNVLIIAGDSNVELINGIFDKGWHGSDICDQCPSESEKTPFTHDTYLENAPTKLSGSYPDLLDPTYIKEAEQMYTTVDGEVSVAFFEYGEGYVYYLGFRWEYGVEQDSFDNWGELLNLIIEGELERLPYDGSPDVAAAVGYTILGLVLAGCCLASIIYTRYKSFKCLHRSVAGFGTRKISVMKAESGNMYAVNHQPLQDSAFEQSPRNSQFGDQCDVGAVKKQPTESKSQPESIHESDRRGILILKLRSCQKSFLAAERDGDVDLVSSLEVGIAEMEAELSGYEVPNKKQPTELKSQPESIHESDRRSILIRKLTSCQKSIRAAERDGDVDLVSSLEVDKAQMEAELSGDEKEVPNQDLVNEYITFRGYVQNLRDDRYSQQKDAIPPLRLPPPTGLGGVSPDSSNTEAHLCPIFDEVKINDGELVNDGTGVGFEFVQMSDLESIEELLGGNFAYGFKAIWSSRNGSYPVFIKVPKSKASRNEEAELKVWMKLPRSPNVLRLFGQCQFENEKIPDPLPSLVTPFQKHGSLEFYMRNLPGDLEPRDYANIILGITRGIVQLHEHNVIHRDIALRNFLLGDDGRILATDFGLSRFVNPRAAEDKLYSDGEYQHSDGAQLPWRWSALETLKQGTSSKKSDIWMLGATIVELFNKAPPFSETRNVLSHVSNISDGSFQLGLPEHCPTSFRFIAQKCCQLEINQRPDAKQIINLILSEYS